MYLCGLCGVCSEPRQSMLKHVVLRLGLKWENSSLYGSIAREIPLCTTCANRPFDVVVRQHTTRSAAIPSLVGQAIAPIGKRALRPSEVSRN